MPEVFPVQSAETVASLLARTLKVLDSGGERMPRVTIKTGFMAPDGCEEELTEYLCDAPDCPNVATHAVGCIPELAASVAVCEEHVPPGNQPRRG